MIEEKAGKPNRTFNVYANHLRTLDPEIHKCGTKLLVRVTPLEYGKDGTQ